LPKIPPKNKNNEDELLEELAQEYVADKKVEAKKIAATKDWLFSRATRTYNIEIDVGGEIRVFKARRLTEKERAKMRATQAGLTTMNPNEIDPQQFEALQKQAYEMLAAVIVEPKLTVEEWENVDIALVQTLIDKVSALQVEVNDAKLVEELKNL
jgi:hypothetical protein